MLSRCRVGAAGFVDEDSARCSRTRSLVVHSPARVSRGVSAIVAAKAFELGPARPSSLAARPGERDQRCVRSVSASLQLRQRAPVSNPFPAHRHRFFTGRVLGGVPPTETGDRAFHDAPERFGGSPAYRRGGLLGLARIFLAPGFPFRFFPGPRRRATVPLTPLSRPSRMPVRAFFAVRAEPTPPGTPRLLPPRPRERAKFSPAWDAFHRQGARCSSSALSSGDCAPSSSRGFHSAFSHARPCGPCGPAPAVPSHPETRSSALRHLRLLLPRVASQQEASNGARAIRDATFPPDSYIRRPSPRSPRPPPVLSFRSV